MSSRETTLTTMRMSKNYSSNRILARWSPRTFLKFISVKENRGSIVRSTFVAPKLGSDGFGKIEVELKYEPKIKIPKQLEQCY